jgi:hypothetical protein
VPELERVRAKPRPHVRLIQGFCNIPRAASSGRSPISRGTSRSRRTCARIRSGSRSLFSRRPRAPGIGTSRPGDIVNCCGSPALRSPASRGSLHCHP